MKLWYKYLAIALVVFGFSLMIQTHSDARAEPKDIVDGPTNTPVAISISCFKDVTALLENLEEEYKEKPLAQGFTTIHVRGGDLIGKMIVYINATNGTFSNVLIFKDGSGCLINSGIEFKPFTLSDKINYY
jgi:hypothetical protein